MYRPWPAQFILSRGLVNFAVQASPSSFSFSVSGGWTSGSTTVTQLTGPSNDTPFTYAWSVIKGSGLTINSPSSQTTTFSAGGAGQWTVQCKVVNTFGQTAVCQVTLNVAAAPPPYGVIVQCNANGAGFDGGGGSTITLAAGQACNGTAQCVVYNAIGAVSYQWLALGSGSGQSSGFSIPGQAKGTGGTFWASCRATDSAGQSGTGEDNVTVSWV